MMHAAAAAAAAAAATTTVCVSLAGLLSHQSNVDANVATVQHGSLCL
jgi:hypothetical protein